MNCACCGRPIARGVEHPGCFTGIPEVLAPGRTWRLVPSEGGFIVQRFDGRRWVWCGHEHSSIATAARCGRSSGPAALN